MSVPRVTATTTLGTDTTWIFPPQRYSPVPLTWIYSPPKTCFEGLATTPHVLTDNQVSTTDQVFHFATFSGSGFVFNDEIERYASCYPPHFATIMANQDYYSPGICPTGYTISQVTQDYKGYSAFYWGGCCLSGWTLHPDTSLRRCETNFTPLGGVSTWAPAISVRWGETDLVVLSQASTALAPPRTTPVKTSATATDSFSFSSTADPQEPSVVDGSKEAGTDVDGGEGSDNTMKLAVGFGVGLGVLFLAFVILAVVVLRRRKRKDGAQPQEGTAEPGSELLGWSANEAKVDGMQVVEAPGDGALGTVRGSSWTPHPSELEGSRVERQRYELVGTGTTHG